MLKELFELKKAQRLLNEKYFDGELPEAIITIQRSGKNVTDSWFCQDKWVDNDGNYFHEINICAEIMNKGKLVVMTALLHSMIHMYCNVNGIAETARVGMYHNRLFKDESAKRDLLTEKTPRNGLSKSIPTDKFQEFVENCDVEDVFNIYRIEQFVNPPIV